MGVDAWIERQLHPERIDDRARRGARGRAAPPPRLPAAELLEGYEVPREAQARDPEEAGGDGRGPVRGRDAPGAARDDAEVRGRHARARRARWSTSCSRPRSCAPCYSERQLDEVLVDFWMNHFNVFASKGPEQFLVGAYERDVIRPHAWGRFEDLLVATAKSPAMLFYLDNWLSADPEARPSAPGGSARAANRAAARAERELRPRDHGAAHARRGRRLHAEGRDRGRARASPAGPSRGLRAGRAASSRSTPACTTAATRWCSGRAIKGGGQEEGEQVLHMLATHPATARFISYKLARRFVADEPPAALVDRAAETFRRTGGDIRAVVRTIVTSPEFFAPAARAAKVKTPLEFVASAVRAVGGRRRRAPASWRGASPTWACRCTSSSRPPATRTPPTPGSRRAACSRA